MPTQSPLSEGKFWVFEKQIFENSFSYNVTKTDGGINFKVEADLRWKQAVVDEIKPAIVADVHKSMNSFGKSLHAGLLSC